MVGSWVGAPCLLAHGGGGGMETAICFLVIPEMLEPHHLLRGGAHTQFQRPSDLVAILALSHDS